MTAPNYHAYLQSTFRGVPYSLYFASKDRDGHRLPVNVAIASLHVNVPAKRHPPKPWIRMSLDGAWTTKPLSGYAADEIQRVQMREVTRGVDALLKTKITIKVDPKAASGKNMVPVIVKVGRSTFRANVPGRQLVVRRRDGSSL